MPEELQMPHKSLLVSEPENIASQIEVNMANAEQQKAFVEARVSEWLASDALASIHEGERYYENDNDILKVERKVIGKNGEMVAAPYLANNRLPHSFMRKLTKQKIGYLLSKPFTVTSDNEEFQAALGDYFDSSFYRMFKNVGKDAIVGGIGWIQPYYDEEGKLCFKRIPSTEIRPFWKDIDHTMLDASLRIYNVEVFNGAERTLKTFVKFFTRDAIYNYNRDEEGVLTVDVEVPGEANFEFETEVAATDSETGEETVVTERQGVMWDRIPLIAMKYNAEEDSLLKFVKALIDEYDKRTSDLANTLQDEPDKIKVVRDYDGTDKGEFIYNLSRYRTLFLRGTGGVETLDTSISTDALENHLTRTRKDIFEFGGGVDTQNKDLGNASGVALKFVYSDLDMDCNDFGAEIAFTLEQIAWFIKQDLLLKTGVDYSEASFEVVFNTDITINESETITNIKNSVGIVSNKTLLEQHPYVTDAAEEEEQLKQEQQLAFETSQEQFESHTLLEQALTPATEETSSSSGSGTAPTPEE